MDRWILHCDMNSFFASVELLEHPELRDKPVAVSGDPETRHGIILAKNEPAKKYGIQTAETIWQARKKCPDLILLPSHHHKYREISKKINEIYLQYTDLVEPFSVDESFLDVTGTLHLFGGDPKKLADEIRERVKGELGLTLSVGVSFNKIFAKLGSDYKKPNATTVILRENYREIIWPLPVTDLLFVGRSVNQVLRGYGISTIGQLAAVPRETLMDLLGKQGGQLYKYANGLENSPVLPYGQWEPPKSVGNGLTFRRNLSGEEEVYTCLLSLSDDVAVRLRKHGLKGRTVQLQIRDPNFKTISRQKPLKNPTDLSREIAAAAMELCRASWNLAAPIRMLTVTAQNLVSAREAGEQLDLFAWQEPQRREKQEKLERTMDRIRDKYGSDSILPASVQGARGVILPK